MARYYFDAHDGFHAIDHTGRELPTLDDARTEAMRVASGFAANPKALGENGGAIVVAVRDGPDTVVMRIRLVFSVETV